MTGQSQQSSTAANLDLAPIGNGRMAALVNTSGRIVWWCFPRLDSDPVFSRLLAGDEEKGFFDVVLHGRRARTRSMCATQPSWRRCWKTAAATRSDHRFCAPLHALRARVSSRADFPPHRAVERSASHHDPRAPDIQLRRAGRGQAIGSNHIRYTGGIDVLRADDRCAAVLHRARDAVRADSSRDPDSRRRRAVRGVDRHAWRANSWSERATIGSTGCAGSAFRSTGKRPSSAPLSR